MMQNMPVNDLKSVLEQKGIYPSYHRIKILKYLIEHRTHPSVDMIYKDLAKEIPTLSKTTIYNTLKLFVKKGLTISIDFEGETRYDIFIEPHAHFKCVKCGRIYDLPLRTDLCQNVELNGHSPLSYQIVIKGICKHCLEAEGENAS